jgi:hypothetical protein
MNDWLVTYNELEGMWEEAVLVWFKLLFQHLNGGTEENWNSPRIIDVPAEIQTSHLSKVSRKR